MIDKVCIVILGGGMDGSGGAERRFIRAFDYIGNTTNQCHLVIEAGMYGDAIKQGFLVNEKNVCVVKSDHRMSTTIVKYLISRKIKIVHFVNLLNVKKMFFLYVFLVIAKSLKFLSFIVSYNFS